MVGLGCSRIVEDPKWMDASANEISLRAWKEEAKAISTLIFYAKRRENVTSAEDRWKIKRREGRWKRQ
ncbi:hypothetical protein GW17_00009309 [Ensete ventricosum]|nr:hypothetical protein GW17_00009309 [Ensete ventricosum]RZS06709.1 hypothetical protein BHM03_00037414 [Ensete ventricosum]